jgi:arginyl-tRNA synthetase
MGDSHTVRDRFAETISAVLRAAVGELDMQEILARLEVPQDSAFGDYAFPCFTLAKTRRKSPEFVAQDIVAALKTRPGNELVERCEQRGAYVNFFVNRQEMTKDALTACFRAGANYGHSSIGAGETIVIDYSSPNIAKPLSIGHLRSTVIGGALYRIYAALGYRCMGVNHLGDWGTQIGTLIAAVKRWVPCGSLAGQSVCNLSELYVRYHNEMAQNEELQAEAREWFRKLEAGDKETTTLWQAFLELTISNLKQTYAMLGIVFDEYRGESFYNDRIQPTINSLAERLAGSRVTQPPGQDAHAVVEPLMLPRMRESEGALIVDLADQRMTPCLLRKADGTTLYATRDIAAAIYRRETYSFARNIYVVAADQRLHFRQLFKVLELAGFEWAKDCVHVDFGLIRFEGEKMATRAGTVVLLEDVLKRSVELTLEKMRERALDPQKRDSIARAVGIGAVIFNDLKHKRTKDVDFDWDQVLRFDGETGPYVQYTFVRIASIFKKHAQTGHRAQDTEHKAQSAGSFQCPVSPVTRSLFADVDFARLSDPEEFELAKLIHRFPAVVQLAANRYEPSFIATYLLQCAGAFHKYYRDIDRHKVVSDDVELTRARLLMCHCLKTVIANGLSLLGIETVDEM